MRPFRVLVADPPWKFRDRLPGKKRGASKHYELLTVPEIQRFPLPPLSEDAVLILWRVSAMVEEAYAVARAWGFTPKSEIVWVKTSPTIEAPSALAMGMGHYVRGAHETAILATRGSPKVRDHGVRSVFFAPRLEHSRKPDAFYSLVERLCRGPYAEIFARRHREGWACEGDELAPVDVRMGPP